MALPLEKLGTTYDEITDVIDPDRAKATAHSVRVGGSGTRYTIEVNSVDDVGGATVIKNGLAEVAPK